MSKKRERKSIPEWVAEGGRVKVLTVIDFPSDVAGKKAFCQYQIAKWTERLADLEAGDTEEGRLARKIALADERAKKFRAELAEIEKAAAEKEAVERKAEKGGKRKR